MKRFFVFLAGLLLLTACSRAPVQDVFSGPQAGVNLLEVQLFDQIYDLGGRAASVIDAMYSSGLIIYDYITFEQYATGGKRATKEQVIRPVDDAFDRNKVVYFHPYPSSFWNQRADTEAAKKYGIPQNGVEMFVYAFPCRKEEGLGILYNFTSADGLTIYSNENNLTDYLCAGIYGMPMSTFDEDSIHYYRVVVDGQPLDLTPYVEAVPATMPEDFPGKESSFILSTPLRFAETIEEVERQYNSSQECRNYSALLDAFYEKLKEVNSRQISNLTVIDATFLNGVLDSVTYCVVKVDAYNPR